jgi:hypothetical protein
MRAGTTPTLARPSHNGMYSILFSMNRATVSPFLYIIIKILYMGIESFSIVQLYQK